jgi:hypothetical protein
MYGLHLKWLPLFMRQPWVYNCLLVVAMFTRVALGFAQLESMTTLNLKLQNDPNISKKL